MFKALGHHSGIVRRGASNDFDDNFDDDFDDDFIGDFDDESVIGTGTPLRYC